MSTFMIFAIVLTVGYIIYYAVVITMDMHKKAGPEVSQEENIPIDDTEDNDIVPRSVVEDTQHSGFTFVENTTSPAEDIVPSETIPQETEEEDLPFPTVTYEQNDDIEPPADDISGAFDASLAEPQFGVTTIIEPSVSSALTEKISKVNEALESQTPVEENAYPSFVMAQIIREKKLNNIDSEDEITRY